MRRNTLSALARQKRQEDNTPIPYKETLEIVNQFVVQTTQFLNRFAVTCEEKLNRVDRDMQRLEVTLSLLESKLSSIEGLGSAPVPTTTTTTTNNTPAATGIPPPPPPPNQQQAASAMPVPPPPPAPVEDTGPKIPKCKDDPRLAEFFKLLRLGAARGQIEFKMEQAGVSVSLLDTPDAPSPLGPIENASNNNAEEEEDDDTDDE